MAEIKTEIPAEITPNAEAALRAAAAAAGMSVAEFAGHIIERALKQNPTEQNLP